MQRASTTEQFFNSMFGQVLREKHPLWKEAIGVEQTHVLQGSPRKHPDLILSLPETSPVAIETEFMPAVTVEEDAVSRLGESLASDARTIENVIALRIPIELRTVEQGGIEDAIRQALFTYCVLSETKVGDKQRWPETGWLQGDVDDVADCLESVSLSESLISRTTDVLEEGVTQTANILKTADESVQQKIAEHLHQSSGEQTNRMAVAIIANAAVFHTRIEGRQGISPIGELRGSTGFINIEVIECWQWIIENVNYWPIFKIASDLLSNIPTVQANRVLNLLYRTASKLADMGATSLNDLSGRMFQKLIADRKFLATFYTLPVSATLLAELAASRLQTDWRDADAVKDLRVADLACGTGTLIGALYHAILTRHRETGCDDAEIHSAMIEESLYAFDIMPAATHLAASTLSNAHPKIVFGTTKIVTMPYGKGRDNVPYIGSLELIANEHTIPLFSLGRQQITGRADQGGDGAIGVPHESLDIVIMNPPFTRPTGHEANKIGVPVPSFAGFNTSKVEQKIMSVRLDHMSKSLPQPVGHGNAGLASNFIDLAHVKLKPGGVLALVLPATFAQGKSWDNARNLLAKRYQDITIATIANDGATNRAFSADTGMAEVLVIATKKVVEEKKPTFQFVNLRRRPENHVEAVELAKFVAALDRRPGAGRIAIGSDDSNGNYINAEEFICGCAGVAEANLAKFMLVLTDGKLWATRRNETTKFPVTTLKELGKRGLYHIDLTGPPPRGPFDKTSLRSGQVPTYPALWGHAAERERSFVVDVDCELLTRRSYEVKAADAWNRFASRLHLTIDFQLNSQSLAACLTPEKALGGRAWPNFILDDERYEIPVMLWLNSTLGLMSYWWEGTRQQLGRTAVKITALPSLPSIDPRRFDEQTMRKADDLFELFRDVEFLPANESYHDPNRKALDEALLVELLGVPKDIADDFDVIRRQWCAEPSVHGGKSTKPY